MLCDGYWYPIGHCRVPSHTHKGKNLTKNTKSKKKYNEQENIGVAYDTLERLTLGAAWGMGNPEMSVQEVKKKLLSD